MFSFSAHVKRTKHGITNVLIQTKRIHLILKRRSMHDLSLFSITYVVDGHFFFFICANTQFHITLRKWHQLKSDSTVNCSGHIICVLYWLACAQFCITSRSVAFFLKHFFVFSYWYEMLMRLKSGLQNAHMRCHHYCKSLLLLCSI